VWISLCLLSYMSVNRDCQKDEYWVFCVMPSTEMIPVVSRKLCVEWNFALSNFPQFWLWLVLKLLHILFNYLTSYCFIESSVWPWPVLICVNFTLCLVNHNSAIFSFYTEDSDLLAVLLAYAPVYKCLLTVFLRISRAYDNSSIVVDLRYDTVVQESK